MSHATFNFGKVDYNETGRKVNKTTVEIELADERLSIVGAVWNARSTDIIVGGRILPEIAALFPDNAQVQRIAEVAKDWHLNDMHPGTPAQEALLAEHEGEYVGSTSWQYYWACDLLAEHDLLVDTSPEYGEKGYKYGSNWLTVPLPAEIRAEVQGWIDQAA
jgi:hypothetical protein